MGKAVRNKRKRTTNEKTPIRWDNLFGLDSRESRFARQERLELWTRSTPCSRLQLLVDYNEDVISPANSAEVMDRFHAGAVSYRTAVETLIGYVAVKILSRHFALCEQRRMRTLDDPLDFMANFMDPRNGADVGTSEQAKFLLLMTFIFHDGLPGRELFPDENWADIYRGVIVWAVDFNYRLASEAQKQLDSGAVSWAQVHGPCEYSQRAAA